MWAVLPGSSLTHASSSEDEDADPYGLFSEDADEDERAPSPGPPADAEPMLAKPPDDAGQAASDEAWQPAAAAPKRATGRYFQPAAARRRTACYQCGSVDHLASECPNDICIVCLSVGHTSADCPSGGRPVVCSLCRRLGHDRRACPEASPPSASDLADVRCVACGGFGHVDCTPYEARPKEPSCWNCGRKGHAADDCPHDGIDRWHRLFTAAAPPRHDTSGANPSRLAGACGRGGRAERGGGRGGGRGHKKSRGGGPVLSAYQRASLSGLGGRGGIGKRKAERGRHARFVTTTHQDL